MKNIMKIIATVFMASATIASATTYEEVVESRITTCESGSIVAKAVFEQKSNGLTMEVALVMARKNIPGWHYDESGVKVPQVFTIEDGLKMIAEDRRKYKLVWEGFTHSLAEDAVAFGFSEPTAFKASEAAYERCMTRMGL